MTPLAAADARDLLDDADFLVAVAALAAVCAAAAYALQALQKWRRRQFDDRPMDSFASLSSYKAMVEAGELSQAEYESIRQRLFARPKPPAVPQPNPPGPQSGRVEGGA